MIASVAMRAIVFVSACFAGTGQTLRLDRQGLESSKEPNSEAKWPDHTSGQVSALAQLLAAGSESSSAWHMTPQLSSQAMSRLSTNSQSHRAVEQRLRTILMDDDDDDDDYSDDYDDDDDEEEVKEEMTEVSRLEIRAGRIVEVSKHPTLEKIFVEKIDLGEDEPRTICSGLQGFMTEDDLLNKDCVVLCNLKPRDLQGTPSNGMVLCASSKDGSEVKLVVPPAGVPVGELIKFKGHVSEPSPTGNRAVKAWKKVADQFATDADGNAMFTGEPSAPMQTSKGGCTSTIKDGGVG